jgi:hypothetical protein
VAGGVAGETPGRRPRFLERSRGHPDDAPLPFPETTTRTEPPTVPPAELWLWLAAMAPLALAVFLTGGLCRQ